LLTHPDDLAVSQLEVRTRPLWKGVRPDFVGIVLVDHLQQGRVERLLKAGRIIVSWVEKVVVMREDEIG